MPALVFSNKVYNKHPHFSICAADFCAILKGKRINSTSSLNKMALSEEFSFAYFEFSF